MNDRSESHLLIRVCSAAEYAAGGMIICVVILVAADVLARAVGLTGVMSTVAVVANYAMPMVCFLPLVATPFHRRFLAVEFLTLREGFISQTVHAIGEVMTLAFVSLLVLQSVLGALSRSSAGQVVEIPLGLLSIWPASWVLPFSLGLGLLVRLTMPRPVYKGD